MDEKKTESKMVILLMALLMISTVMLTVVVPPASATVTSDVHFTSGWENGPWTVTSKSKDGMAVGFAPGGNTWEQVRGDAPYTTTNASVSTDAAHHGTYGLKVNITADTPPASVDVHLRFGRAGQSALEINATELWARMAIKFDNLPSNYGNDTYTYREFDVLRMRGYVSTETDAAIKLVNYNGTAKWVARYGTYDGVNYAEINIPINTSLPEADTWYIVELHAKTCSAANTPDGQVHIYVDGTEIWSKTDIVNLTSETLAGFEPSLGHIRVGGGLDPYENFCWMMDCFEVISSGGPILNNNVAIFTVSPTTGYSEWTTFTFSGAGSCAPGGATYTWDFGDTTGGTGQVVTHAYTATGSYNATLTVTGSGAGTAGCKITVNSRKLYVDPNLTKQHSPANTSFTVVIKVEDVIDLYTWVIGLQWDPTILYCHNVRYMYDWFPGADALVHGKDVGYVESPGSINNTGGYVAPWTMGRRGVVGFPSTYKGINGSGPLFNATFSFVSIGASDINLTGPFAGPPQLINSSVQSIYVGQFDGDAELLLSPTACFTENAIFIYVGDWINFNATCSQPGFNGSHYVPIANYTWDFGDGNIITITGTEINRKYTANGTYTVNLTVTCEDDSVLISEGLTSDSTWKNITVSSFPSPPVASFTKSLPPYYVNSAISFDASGSTSGWNGTHSVPIANYTWNFGDLNVTTVTVPTITHAYASAGEFQVNLTVMCEDDPKLIEGGLTTNSTWHNVTVTVLRLFHLDVKTLWTNGSALVGANATVSNTTYTSSGTTNSSGLTSFSLARGLYNLTVSYAQVTINQTTNLNVTQDMTVTITTDPAPFERIAFLGETISDLETEKANLENQASTNLYIGIGGGSIIGLVIGVAVAFILRKKS